MSWLRLHKGSVIHCLQIYYCVLLGKCFRTYIKRFFYYRWVDQCDGAHDHNRRIERFEVGQNWAMLAGSYLGAQAIGLSGSQMVQNWYDEVTD